MSSHPSEQVTYVDSAAVDLAAVALSIGQHGIVDPNAREQVHGGIVAGLPPTRRNRGVGINSSSGPHLSMGSQDLIRDLHQRRAALLRDLHKAEDEWLKCPTHAAREDIALKRTALNDLEQGITDVAVIARSLAALPEPTLSTED